MLAIFTFFFGDPLHGEKLQANVRPYSVQLQRAYVGGYQPVAPGRCHFFLPGPLGPSPNVPSPGGTKKTATCSRQKTLGPACGIDTRGRCTNHYEVTRNEIQVLGTVVVEASEGMHWRWPRHNRRQSFGRRRLNFDLEGGIKKLQTPLRI